MINKEFIVKDGAIYKDFIDRNIPQYSNNQVCVSVLIPAGVFVGNDDYSVILAVGYRQQTTSPTTTLNTLVMTASKSITIDGVLYVKYSAILSYYYTENLGQLLLSPYIRKIIHTQGDYNEETQEYEDVALLSSQDGYTHTQLNVIKSVLPQYDASLENPQVVDTLNGKIEAKKIYTFIDTESASVGEHYYNLATGYNPTASQFEGCLVVSVYNGATTYVMPYSNDGVELLEITSDGVFYKISGVSYNSGTSTYTYTKTQLSYSKSEIDTALNLKVDKTQKVNGHALSGDIDITKGDVGLGNVVNYGVESTPSASGSDLYITSKGVYDALQLVYTAISGCATDEDLTTINNRLESIESIIGSDDGDADNVINTLKEVISALSGLGEDANILNLINAKASQSDFNTLNSQINGEGGIKTKVDFLYDSNANAYAEIKAQSGTIDILVDDWDDNDDANYPYKWELSNGYLVGAKYVSVVFDKDSDTSMLSATVGIDDTNGKVIFYASELPSAIISIQLIAIFNSVNAYELYNQTLVSQVNSNTQAISDINNTKLPQYVKNEASTPNQIGGDNVSYVYMTGDEIELKNVAYDSNAVMYVKSVVVGGKRIKLSTSKGLTTPHELILDEDGNLTLDGNAVGGGGKQLYQHNISIKDTTNKVYCNITIINQKSTSLTRKGLYDFLIDNGFTSNSVFYACCGAINQGGTWDTLTGVYVPSSNAISFIFGGTYPMTYGSYSGIEGFTDTVITL